MRFGRIGAVVASAVVALLVGGGAASGGGRSGVFRHAADTGGDGDGNKDIAVRQVTISPVRAHVGDTVRVDIVIESKGEGYGTIPLEIFANKSVVGRKLFTFGWSPAEWIYHETIAWDTHGVPPGEYRIRAEAFVWGDSSPGDNSLEVGKALVLAAPGAPFPGGKAAGGRATERDPRFVDRARESGMESGEESGAGGGY